MFFTIVSVQLKTFYHSDITSVQRTISLKIEMPEEFADYLATCATIFNSYVAWSFDTKNL
jgi:hypothetical protein